MVRWVVTLPWSLLHLAISLQWGLPGHGATGTGSRQKVNNIPLPLEGEYGGMHCISKLNTAMIAESHGLLKRLCCELGKNSSCIMLFSFLMVSNAEVHGFTP